MDASAGFDGKTMPQSWVPVMVELFNDGPPVEGLVEVSAAFPDSDAVYGKPVVLPTNSRKRLWLYPHTGNYTSQYSVRFVAPNGRVIADTTTPLQTLAPNTALLVTGTRSEFNFLPYVPNVSMTSVRVNPVTLPDDVVGFESVKMLVIADARDRF